MTKTIAYRCDRCGIGASDDRIFSTLSCTAYWLRKASPRYQLDLCAACFAEMLEWTESPPTTKRTVSQLIEAMEMSKKGGTR